ncbi:hypothetical protein [Rhodopirellula sallentina]|uniref:Putative secreted protein n=1 Tax=Rhodopirellula sallentina SM41 TaxID=1263870 RepID=M5UJ54_9BACT|nr:hypothetical protein [Rhodopirellula sallentina]EMI56058.1 putative secreted protein [Rhodopirellula sallentina SM41]
MKRIIICTLVFFVIAAALPTLANPPIVPSQEIPPLMRMKLEKSKAILEGLTLEDYEMVAANARSLRLLSLEAGWNVLQTKEYASQSRDFRRSTDLIAQAAEGKDINRATLGYVAMTVRCVECHSYMRKHRIELMNYQTE